MDAATLSANAVNRWADPVYRAKTMAAGRAGRARIKAGEGFLYTAEVPNTGYVKIGFALNPLRRVAEQKLRLLAFAPGSIFQERALHKTLRPHMIKGFPRPQATEHYPRSILSHPAIPAELRSAA